MFFISAQEFVDSLWCYWHTGRLSWSSSQ